MPNTDLCHAGVQDARLSLAGASSLMPRDRLTVGKKAAPTRLAERAETA